MLLVDLPFSFDLCPFQQLTVAPVSRSVRESLHQQSCPAPSVLRKSNIAFFIVHFEKKILKVSRI